MIWLPSLSHTIPVPQSPCYYSWYTVLNILLTFIIIVYMHGLFIKFLYKYQLLNSMNFNLSQYYSIIHSPSKLLFLNYIYNIIMVWKRTEIYNK